MAAPTADGAQDPDAAPRGPMNWFIDAIELVAAPFVGIVAARHLPLGHAALFLQRADPGRL